MLALWLGDLSAFASRLGRWVGLSLWMAVLLPLTFAMSWRSAHKYFVEKAGQAFDVAPTYVAKTLGDIKDRPVRGVFAATGFVHLHPPVNLFRQGKAITSYFNLAQFLPPTETPDQDLLIFMLDEYGECMPALLDMFPGAEVKVLANTSRVGGRDIGLYLDLSRDYLAKQQGLRAQVTRGGKVTEVLNATVNPADPALRGADRITWKGSLILRQYGVYQLYHPQGGFRARVDGQDATGKEVTLAMGAHRIEVEWTRGGAMGQIRMRQRPAVPGQTFNAPNADSELSVSQTWMDYEPRGFYGRYYNSKDWSGQAAAETIEPVLFARWLDPPLYGHWSGRWKTRFKISQSGVYSFRAPVSSYSDTKVDGRLVNRTGATPDGLPPVGSPAPSVRLEAGWHTLEYRFSSPGQPWVDLRWSGPGFSEKIFYVRDMVPLKD
jgi:hypothetical protein